MVHKVKATTGEGIEVEISEEDFEEYETVRMSGITNMFNVNLVENVTGLSRDKIFAIMNDYSKLDKEFKLRNSEKLKKKADAMREQFGIMG